MDKPEVTFLTEITMEIVKFSLQVAVHLFQAGAHRVKLGIMRGKVSHTSNYVGVF